MIQDLPEAVSNLHLSSNSEANMEQPTTHSSTTTSQSLRISCVPVWVFVTWIRLKKHLKYCDNLHIDSTPADAILDLGDMATMHKKPRN